MFTKNENFQKTTAEIEENLGLVRLCAQRFLGRGIEYDDLYSAGCIGLVKASKAFDETRGVRFSTYAVPVILGEIKRLFRDGGSVKISRVIKQRASQIAKATKEYQDKFGITPTIATLCELTSLSQSDICEAIACTNPTVSLTADKNDGEIKELNLPSPPPDDEIINNLAISQALKTLPEQDRAIIYLRFYKNLTQSQTAKILSTTQVQISRKEKKILTILREQLV